MQLQEGLSELLFLNNVVFGQAKKIIYRRFRRAWNFLRNSGFPVVYEIHEFTNYNKNLLLKIQVLLLGFLLLLPDKCHFHKSSSAMLNHCTGLLITKWCFLGHSQIQISSNYLFNRFKRYLLFSYAKLCEL